MMATKSDIVKDIVADVISQEIHNETGIACSRRENTEIRVNIIKLEQLVKQYDLNNPAKEVPLYESTSKTGYKKIPGLEKLKTYAIMKADIAKRRAEMDEWNRGQREKRAIARAARERARAKKKRK